MISREEVLQKKKNTRISFVHGDATIIEWSNADVVYFNSTCFEDVLMRQLTERASLLKPNSFVITTTVRYCTPDECHILVNHFI